MHGFVKPLINKPELIKPYSEVVQVVRREMQHKYWRPHLCEIVKL